jgi:ferrous iron transport protein A
MGLTPGADFRVIRTAPMGDPVEIQVRGFRLSLRRDEASTLCVERI